MDNAEIINTPDIVNEVQLVELAQSLDFACNGIGDVLAGAHRMARQRAFAAAELLVAVVERAEAGGAGEWGLTQSLCVASRKRLALRTRAALDGADAETQRYQSAPNALADAAGQIASAVAATVNRDARGMRESAVWALEALAFAHAMTKDATS